MVRKLAVQNEPTAYPRRTRKGTVVGESGAAGEIMATIEAERAPVRKS
ncbi:hypothetical protein TBS_35540 [Thermobispora bispora]